MSFSLTIVTPSGLHFQGQADRLTVRTTEGDLAILARHMNLVCPLGKGLASVEAGGRRRTAACRGGLLAVINGEVLLIPTAFEWTE